MNITGSNIMIFAKEFDGKMFYRAGLQNKKTDGSIQHGYIDVRFPNSVEVDIQTKQRINILRGFLTFYKNKEGKDVFYLVIQEFKKLETQKEEPKEVYEIKTITAEQLDDPELPF